MSPFTFPRMKGKLKEVRERSAGPKPIREKSGHESIVSTFPGEFEESRLSATVVAYLQLDGNLSRKAE